MRAPLRSVTTMVVVVTTLVMGACASDPPPKPTPKPAPKPEPVVEAPPEPEGPRTWDDVPELFGSKCPGPLFDLPETKTVEALGRTYTIEGSRMRLEGGPWKGPLKLGVLGAVKDPDVQTRANVKKALKDFKRLGVHFIVANGDLLGDPDHQSDLADVIKMLAQETATAKLPLFAHSGNYEWTTAFTENMVEVAKTNPHVFNLNLLRHIDLGGVHLLSLPGWSNRKFVQPAACFYDKSHVDALIPIAKQIADKGEVAVVVAHGPPRGRGKQAIDFAHNAGNVGDEDLARLLVEVPVRFGLFSHILEAGGRATSDVEVQRPVKLPMMKGVSSLYINAGSASSFAYSMHGKKTSRGMAAVFVLDEIAKGGKARVTFLKLR